MRQLHVEVPREQGARVAALAREHRGLNVACLDARAEGEARAFVMASLPNREVGPFIQDLSEIEEARVTLPPRGVFAFRPPPDEAPDEVTDVGPRSPVEIYLASLQSIGSYTGLVGYALAGGVVVWIGLYTNTVYLLVAAMLIAPYAGPAMNAAVASATGDFTLLQRGLLQRGLLRYGLSLAGSAAAAAALSLLMRQDLATPLMIDVSQVSIVAVLLPLTAGAAGALHLVQSERSSLVSGAAVGILVAASLAPPVGLLGMASVMGEWGLVGSAAFVLVLQLAGINLSGAIVFRLYGLRAHGTRFIEGTGWLFPAALAASAMVLVGLFVGQVWSPPALQRSSRAQQAAFEIREAVRESGLALPVEVEARFTRAEIEGQHTLLGVVYAQRGDTVTAGKDELERRLTERIQARLRAEGFNVTPLLSVTVLDPPPGARPDTTR